MKLLKKGKSQFAKLCAPAQVYLVISVLSFIVVLLQNLQNPNLFCVGNYSVECPNNIIFFLIKIMYIAVWVFILQKLCGGGYTTASWILVLLPIIAMFIFIGLAMIFFAKMTMI